MLWTLKKFIGVILLLVGLVALVTPMTPGSWLALVGIEMLGLTFLLPRFIREPYERFKVTMKVRLRQFFGMRSDS